MSTKSHFRSNALFVSLLGALIVGELGRFKIYGNIYLSVADIATALYVGYTLVILRDRLKNAKTLLTWTLALFFIFVFTLLFRAQQVPPKEILVAALYPIRWVLYALLPAAIYLELRQKQTVPYLHYLLYAIAAIAVLGLFQIFLFPNLQFLENYGFDPHYFRLVSTWLDPNFVGAALVCGLLLCVTEPLPSKKSLTLGILIFIALILTFSRSAYMMYAIAGASYALLRRSWKLAGALALSFAIIFVMYTFPRAQIDTSRNINRDFSANFRLMSYLTAYNLFKDRPLTGVGFNLVRYERVQHGFVIDTHEGGNSGAGIDSSWLLVLATTGVIGVSFYIAYWIRIAFLIAEPAKQYEARLFGGIITFIKHGTAAEHMIISYLIAWSVHAWFVNSLFYPLLLIIWGILAGSVLAQKSTD